MSSINFNKYSWQKSMTQPIVEIHSAQYNACHKLHLSMLTCDSQHTVTSLLTISELNMCLNDSSS